MPGLEAHVERRAARRPVKLGSQLKENKVVITSEPRLRHPLSARRQELEFAVDSPECQLLVRLFVPAKLLIKNNRVSLKQLRIHLPNLVGEALPELNFQLHILLASIVTSYVSSWYLLKLNTDNFEFVQTVYVTLCEVARQLSRRVALLADPLRSVSLINQLAEVLNQHIEDCQDCDGVPRFHRRYLAESRFVADHNSLPELKARYLAGHQLFQGKGSRPQYLRVVARNVLDCVFRDALCTVQAPGLSQIISDLLTIIVADVVLDKVTSKLASADFLLETIVPGAMGRLAKAAEKDGTTQSTLLALEKMGQALTTMFSTIVSFLKVIRGSKSLRSRAPSLLFSPILSLLNTITDFTNRKPMLASVLTFLRAGFFSFGSVADTIENQALSFAIERIVESVIKHDHDLAQVIESLQKSTFDRSGSATKLLAEHQSVHQMAESIFHTLDTIASSRLPIKFSLMAFAYRGETEADIKKSIERFLKIFSLEGLPNANDGADELNTLLVMKMFDVIIMTLFPELTCHVQLAD